MSRVMIALIDAGFPAKRHLFQPLAKKDNEKVWPKSSGKERSYCIVKGEKYNVSDDYTGGDLFGEVKSGKVSSDKKDS